MGTMGKATQTQTNGKTRRRAARPSPHPIFDAMIMEAQRTPPDDLIGHEELGRQLGITEAEREEARAAIAQWEPDELDGPNDEDEHQVGEVPDGRSVGGVDDRTATRSPGRIRRH